MLSILILTNILVFIPQVSAVTVSPVKLEITGDPGKTLNGELRLFNEEAETRTLYSSSENFEAQGETGTPNFLTTKDGLASWIKIQDQITIKSKEEKVIPFTIQIPKDAEAGGYFSGILWATNPPSKQGESQVSVSGKVGVLVLLKVSGEVKEGGGLLEFSTKNRQKFFTALPVSIVYRFSNDGGDRVVPSGEIKIKNLFGSVLATLPANETKGSVLPGGARRFGADWTIPKAKTEVEQPEVATTEVTETPAPGFFGMAGQQWSNFHMGVYTASIDLTWGETSQAASAQYRFFIIPWQLLLMMFIIIVIVVVGGTLIIKKYNKWLISKIAKQQKA